MTVFEYQDMFPLSPDTQTSYRLVTSQHVRVDDFHGTPMLVVDPVALTVLAEQAMRDVSFLLRTKHLEQVAAVVRDPEASANDRGVALAMLQNAQVAAKFQLPFCQDTGTATIVAHKGQQVFTADQIGRASCRERV